MKERWGEEMVKRRKRKREGRRKRVGKDVIGGPGYRGPSQLPPGSSSRVSSPLLPYFLQLLGRGEEWGGSGWGWHRGHF